MKSTGIIRKIDELGRVVLPAEIRRTLKIAVGDELEIFTEGDQVVLRRFESSCVFCSSTKGLVSYCEKMVCQSCIRNLRGF